MWLLPGSLIGKPAVQEGTQAASAEALQGKNGGLQPRAGRVSHLTGRCPIPVKTSRDHHLGQYHDCTSRGADPELEPPSQAPPKFLTQINYEVVNVYCFKSLSFEGIFITAIDN